MLKLNKPHVAICSNAVLAVVDQYKIEFVFFSKKSLSFFSYEFLSSSSFDNFVGWSSVWHLIRTLSIFLLKHMIEDITNHVVKVSKS